MKLKGPYLGAGKTPWVRDVFMAAVVLLVYGAINIGSSSRADIALQHSRNLLSLEQALVISFEFALQKLILGNAMAPFLTSFYAFVHPLVTLGLLAELYLSGAREYFRVRNVFVVFSLLAFSVYVLYPAAPPRMLEEYGFVDLLKENAPVSYDSDLVRGVLNPYATMPSVHFGYSLIIGGTLTLLFKRRPFAVLGVAYPALMLIAVTASANHFFLDCIVAALLLAAATLGVRKMERMKGSI